MDMRVLAPVEVLDSDSFWKVVVRGVEEGKEVVYVRSSSI
jgi:hypothetical protein